MTSLRANACESWDTAFLCPNSGVKVVLTARVENASTCTVLRQFSTFSALYPLKTVRCASGSVRVVVPAIPNIYGSRVKLTYGIRVRNTVGTTERTVWIRERAAAKHTRAPTPTPAPTPAPTPPPSPPGAPVQSTTNWAGYEVDGGPFTAASGTFNVPLLSNSSRRTDVVEWVGIDGADNSSLIQAGIGEELNPTTNLAHIYAFWEILPDPETIIPMQIAAGDQITVSIQPVAGSNWGISVTDNTNGQTFSTEQYYNGPGDSVEWIVEDPTSLSGSLRTFANYSPPVTFTNTRFTGTQISLTMILLQQNGVTLATPSPIDPATSSFTVAYGATTPPTP